MEFVSDRVSVERTVGALSVVISARPTPLQRSLLLAWVTAWTLCGAYFLFELTRVTSAELRQGLVVMLAFWAYFEFHVVRTLLWRLKGFELWRLKEGRLTVKNSVWRYGKANDYFVENIQRFGPLAIDEGSWKWQLNDSFWNRGAERLGFEYQGRKVAMGRGLTAEEGQRLARLMTEGLKQARKVTA
jgi:hypothetical protein